jgi:hypothetical protein
MNQKVGHVSKTLESCAKKEKEEKKKQEDGDDDISIRHVIRITTVPGVANS